MEYDNGYCYIADDFGEYRAPVRMGSPIGFSLKRAFWFRNQFFFDGPWRKSGLEIIKWK